MKRKWWKRLWPKSDTLEDRELNLELFVWGALAAIPLYLLIFGWTEK